MYFIASIYNYILTKFEKYVRFPAELHNFPFKHMGGYSTRPHKPVCIGIWVIFLPYMSGCVIEQTEGEGDLSKKTMQTKGMRKINQQMKK